jgi:peptidoglycan/LPS O-acetylase OafA/YrhL
MSEWNDNHIFTTTDKIYMLLCGLIVAIAISWVTYVYFEYRVVNMKWTAEHGSKSPSEFWDIPTWNWKPVFNKLEK